MELMGEKGVQLIQCAAVKELFTGRHAVHLAATHSEDKPEA